ncbi:helix-turn-helix domain-containing protein [Priestia megaterium]|uniref:helix-turn-helix domain-containing protein n=1 Tax=Priestia megaterium TaxID=1404 RepID=UPI001C234204|nr:helix-turn-helix domain-containing protein [Priestia megaterium]MBU8690570.1 helix-turn-helix domain-containing protein [Priestia megaterium]
MTNTNKIDMSTINYAKKQLKERAEKLELDNQPKPFTVKIKQHLDVETGELYNKGEISVSLDFVRDGGLTDIKHTAFKLLVALASHIDKDGFTFVTQQTLADDVGIKDRNQVAQQLKVLMEAEQPLVIGDRFRNPKTNKYNWMYYLVGCEYIYEEYNYVENDEDIIPLDDDIDYYLDDSDDVEDIVEDNTEVVAEEAVPVEVETQEESLFIMPEIVKETVTEATEPATDPATDLADNTEEDNTMSMLERATEATEELTDSTTELTGIDKLRAFSEQSMPTYKAPTIVKDVKKETQDTKATQDVDMSIFKEVHDDTSTYEKPKFKRGSKTSVGSVKKTAEDIDAEYNEALKVFGM